MFNLFKKSFLLICTLLSTSAFADPTPGKVECRRFKDGYNVMISRSETRLGTGYYTALTSCLQAVEGARNWAVCAAQNGGAAVYSVYTGQQLGEGYFTDSSSCLSAVRQGYNGLVCAADNGGTAVVNAYTGEKLGSGHFTYTTTCQAQIDQAQSKGFLCGATNGGAAVFSVSGKRYGEGYFTSLDDCNLAVTSVSNSTVCGAEASAVYAYSRYTGKLSGGPYSSIAVCYANNF